MRFKFPSDYRQLLEDLMGPRAYVENNTRTGRQVRVWPGMRHLEIDLLDHVIPTCGLRKTHPHVAAAENAWTLLGHDHIEWLEKHTKVWNQFADEDICDVCLGNSRTNPGTGCLRCYNDGRLKYIREAYGFRWKHAFGRDQINCAIKALIIDSSNRRVWISSWHPGEDGLDREGQKTVPCPVGFTLQVMDNRLFSTYVLRSSDTFLGLPHDVMRHAYLMAAVAQSLSVELGVMSFAIANSHLYDKHWDLAREAITKDVAVPELFLPEWTVQMIENSPDAYVNLTKIACKENGHWPKWDPKPELIK